MSLDCTTPKYDELYARWLSNPGALLDLAGYDPARDSLLDLCGGTGAVSLEAVRRGGRDIRLLDLSPRCPDPRVVQVRGRAEDVGDLADEYLDDSYRPAGGAFDLVVCRQAVAYLDVTRAFAGVARVLRTGGRFAFNSFRRPRWSARTYVHGGRRFLEASAHAFGRVVHLQASPRIGADVSAFRWRTEQELAAALGPWFDVETFVSERSSRWLCRKR